uniref:RING-type E3 ubiquitin transferase n=1 Tax=Oryza punctata TaxID=4537 RepID=A0A0E0L8T0_ORYPU
MDTSSSASPPPPPGATTRSVLSTIEDKMSPGVLLIIAILAVVFFLFGLLNLLVQNLLRMRRAQRRRRRVGDGGGGVGMGSPTAFQGQLQQLFHLHDAGVDQTFIDALPVFVYRAVVGAGLRKDDPFDCAVCLCEFAGDDKLRLLPTCGHAFHVPCIDAWLLSHSTCPICRGSVLAADDDDSPSPASSPVVRCVLESESLGETLANNGGGESPRARDIEGFSPKAASEEEVVEVKLGKLKCIDGNGNAGDLAVVKGTTSNNDGDIDGGRGNLGQRRCFSMGSYEYVMDEHAALRVAVRTPKRRPASSRSRRRLALSECDFAGSVSKKGAWEAVVTEAASAGTAAAAARLNKDSFSMSKIWMMSATKKEEDGRTAAELAGGGRRAASFRWPAMAEVSKKHGRINNEHRDVEAGGNCDSSLADERPSSARTALQYIVGGGGGWQQSSRVGSHS